MNEIFDVALTIYCEAASELDIGKMAVAQIIQNRASTRNKTRSQIVKEPLQFSCWNGAELSPAIKFMQRIMDGDLTRAEQRIWWTCNYIASQTEPYPPLAGKWMNFYNPALCSPSWAKTPKQSMTIGNHLFLEL